MDGREGMAFSGGPPPYYIHRGHQNQNQVQGFQLQQQQSPSPPGFRPLTNIGFQVQSNVRGAHVGPTFSAAAAAAEPPYNNSQQGINMGSCSSPGGVVGQHHHQQQQQPQQGGLKKKRGRPRKYGPVSLGLSPMSSANNNNNNDCATSSEKRNRGRPPGSGRKQQLAALGEWMNSSAGLAFAPHVITIGAGEDIVTKLLSLSQQRPRALCIMSGTGTVSSVTLRQPASTNISLTYEGRFQILCLSGSYLVAEDGGPRDRTGGLSVSLSCPDGQVIGGGVAVLMAASPVQVVVCSFVYGSAKMKTKQVTSPKAEKNSEPKTQTQTQTQHDGNKLNSPITPASAQNYTLSSPAMWPGDLKSSHTHSHTGIDLTRG